MILGKFNKNKGTYEGFVTCNVCKKEYFWNEQLEKTYIATEGEVTETENGNFMKFILYSPCTHCKNNNIHTCFINEEEVKK